MVALADQSKVNVPEIEQCILVITDKWSATKGRCYLLSKANNQWSCDAQFNIVLGRNGMKWGKGVHRNQGESYKQEGDGCSPAGMFQLGTGFGHDLKNNNKKWPIREITSQDRFVDDSNSPYYNQWVQEPKEGAPKWTSAEHMKRPDGLYKRGLVINHNMGPVMPKYGSAIFFHIWKSASATTAGCTATTQKNMERLLAWLSPEAKPILIQLPASEFVTATN